MKSLNELVDIYTLQLRQGEIQAAYKGILKLIGALKSDFQKRYPDFDIGSIYQGYLDMTYFSLSTELMRDNGVKIAVVYLHEKKDFEAWLSARNRQTAKRLITEIKGTLMVRSDVFHDDGNQDAIIECTLVSSPDFENQDSLIDVIEKGVIKFENTVNPLLGIKHNKQ